MFRRGVITLMVLTALGVSLTGWVSCYAFQCGVLRVTPHHWLILHMGDGLMRMFWVAAQPDRVDLMPTFDRRFIRVVLDEFGPPVPARRNMRVTPYGISLGRRGQVPSFGYLWRRPLTSGTGPGTAIHSSMVRGPVWVPVVLLLIYPGLAFLRGPLRHRKRKRRNQCLQCGYSLIGLPEPRCPEARFRGEFVERVYG